MITPVSWNNGYDGASISGNLTLPISSSGGGGAGVYDYFVRDYQENVRMILTEEVQTSVNLCTMETARASNETPYFGQLGANNEVTATRLTTKPAGWASNTSSAVAKLSKLSGHTIGPNSLLKVMAGDVLNASADYYYPAAVTNNTNSLVGDIVSTLVQAISGSATTTQAVKNGTAGISSNLTPSFSFESVADPNRAFCPCRCCSACRCKVLSPATEGWVLKRYNRKNHPGSVSTTRTHLRHIHKTLQKSIYILPDSGKATNVLVQDYNACSLAFGEIPACPTSQYLMDYVDKTGIPVTFFYFIFCKFCRISFCQHKFHLLCCIFQKALLHFCFLISILYLPYKMNMIWYYNEPIDFYSVILYQELQTAYGNMFHFIIRKQMFPF